MSETEFDSAAARMFLGYIYEGLPNYIWIGGPDPRDAGKKKARYPGECFGTSAAELDRAVAYAAGRHAEGTHSIYYRTTTMAEPPSGGGRGGGDESCVLPILFLDLDYGSDGHKRAEGQLPNPPDEAAARQVLADVIELHGLPEPTMLVHSGGGLYPIWVIDRDTDTLFEDIAAANRGLQDAAIKVSAARGWHYGDVGDLARVLRLLGAPNRKPDRIEPAQCRLVGGTSERIMLDRFPRRAKVETSAPAYSGSGEITGPFDALAVHASWADTLEPAGWSFVDEEHGGIDAGGSELWDRPGGGSAAYSARAYEHGLVVWSDAAGLPSGGERKLTKGRVFAHLYHDGDMSAAAQDLHRAAKGESCSEAAKRLPEKVHAAVREADNQAFTTLPDWRREVADTQVGRGSEGFEGVLTAVFGESREGSEGFEGLLLDVFKRGGPTPLPSGGAPLPLPDSCSVLRDTVIEVADALQVNQDMVLTMALPVLASAIKGQREVRILDGWCEPLSVCAVVCQGSGENKTGTLGKLRAPIDRWQGAAREVAAPAVRKLETEVKIARGVYDRLSKKAFSEKGTVTDKREAIDAGEALRLAEDALRTGQAPLWVADSDGSPEAFTKMLSEQRAYGIISDEPGLFSALGGQYGGKGKPPPIEWFLKATAGAPVMVSRIGRDGGAIERPVLSALSCIQTGRMVALGAVPEFRASGLLARQLFSMAADRAGSRSRPRPISADVERRWNDLVEGLLGLGKREGLSNNREIKINYYYFEVIPCQPEAVETLLAFRDELEPQLTPLTGRLSGIADWVNKAVGTSARLAGIFTLAANPAAVSVGAEAVRDAIALVRAYASHTLAAFDLADPEMSHFIAARDILTAVRAAGPGPISKRDLHQSLKDRARFKTVDTLDVPLRILTEHGAVVVLETKPDGGGRPSTLLVAYPHAKRDTSGKHPQNPQNPAMEDARTATPAKSDDLSSSDVVATVTPIHGQVACEGCSEPVGARYASRNNNRCRICVEANQKVSTP